VYEVSPRSDDSTRALQGLTPDELREEVEGLRRALASRAVIEQAKGIVMATAGCDADEAFRILVQQSQHQNRKLREVAAELVELQERRPAAPA
jgi:AmiR/NasT family two-component response regulator